MYVIGGIQTTVAVDKNPLVHRCKTVLPPLHIKLILLKDFAKAINEDGERYKYSQPKFPQLSDAKVKENIFVGSQNRNLMKDESYKITLK